MATTLQEVHSEAYVERQKAPFMDDPTIATPGTVEDVRDSVIEQVVPSDKPVVINPESGADLEHNPYETVTTLDEGGKEVDPVGAQPEDDDDADDPQALDTVYDEVNTSNDIAVNDPAERDEFGSASLVAADEDEDDAPAKSAGKAEWVEYAVAQGADREEAEASTKAELVEQYG